MRSSFITLTFAVACLLGSSLASPIYVERDTGLGGALGNVGGTVGDIAGNGVLGDDSLVGGNDVQDTVGGATEATSDVHDPLSKRFSPPNAKILAKLLKDPKILAALRSKAASAAPGAIKRDLPIGAVTGLTEDPPVGDLTGILGGSSASTDGPASTSDASTNVGPSVEDGQAIRKRGPTDSLDTSNLTGAATDLTSVALGDLPSPDGLPFSADALDGISPEVAAALASAADAGKNSLPSLPLGESEGKSDAATGTAPDAPVDAAKPASK
ncbi:hypothetical protein BCV72DRAFT_219430 [Rhizopus microsporus var. microsporus]|uniref:Uncharacterized protein n=1 Tax=Rhizopus microsporus var. microsporus TaxID=86635 RepID=A0A1X0RI44_RHIZD|nr:hypothetical protein BCV72DRAFT_219430 [Rhizopus microsporus var. microsporus]